MRTLFLLVALAGCGRMIHSDFVRTRPGPHPTTPRPPETVEVFIAERPARPFTEIGFVEVQEARGRYTSSELVAELRARAGQEGCDAVIFLGDNDAVWSSSSSSTSTTTSGDDDGSGSSTTTTTTESDSAGTRNGYRGACIVYLDPVSGAPGATAPQ